MAASRSIDAWRVALAVEEDEEDVKEADGEFNEEFAALLKRLPVQIQEYYRDGGITTLYDWQRRCIAEMNADASSNYIYSLPTSSGKTLVAELLALQNVFLDGKDAFFVLPFVAVAEEKAAAFTRILARFDPEHAPFQVEVYAGFKGRLPPIRRKRKPIIFVATIEKGYALLHALFEKRRMMRNLGLVVVDELHMLGTSRGSLLELFLTLLRVQQRPPLASSSKMFTSRQEDCVYAEHSARIVAMSATLSNMSELCQFLNAKEFVGTFRPVALEEHVKSANHCFTVPEFLVWSQAQVKHGPSSDKRAKLAATSTQDTFPLILNLCREALNEGGSILVFNSSKAGCQSTAAKLAREFDILARSKEPPKALAERSHLRERLSARIVSNNNSETPLSECVKFGVGYHHASMSTDDRELIERAFLRKSIVALVCTSTLAAGVNLPARRVIINGMKMGYRTISKSEYKQMSGRAGRAGIDEYGESFLLVPDDQLAEAHEMLAQNEFVCESQMFGGEPCRLTLTFIAVPLFD